MRRLLAVQAPRGPGYRSSGPLSKSAALNDLDLAEQAGAQVRPSRHPTPSVRSWTAATRPSAAARGVPGHRRAPQPHADPAGARAGRHLALRTGGLARQPVTHDDRPGGTRTCQRLARARCACASWTSAEPAARRSCRSSEGGGRGIRTPGALPHNGFQDRHIRPLCQPSSRSTDVRPPRRPSLASRQLRRGSRPWSDYLGEPAGVSPELPCRPAARAWRAGPAR